MCLAGTGKGFLPFRGAYLQCIARVFFSCRKLSLRYIYLISITMFKLSINTAVDHAGLYLNWAFKSADEIFVSPKCSSRSYFSSGCNFKTRDKERFFLFLHCLTLMCTLHFFSPSPLIYQPLWNFPCQFIVVLEKKHNFNPTELVGIFQVFLSCFDKLNEEKMEMQE